jgi:RNA-directed DNA polymerase
MSPVNTDELELALMLARQRVLKIQTKLHRWARYDPHRRFDDLFNLVADPAILLVAWDRVSGNKGAATAGVDRRTASSIAATQGSRSSSTNYGPASRTVVSARCRCASG